MPWHRCPSEVCEGKATTMRGKDTQERGGHRVCHPGEAVVSQAGKELGVRAEERGAPLPSVLT